MAKTANILFVLENNYYPRDTRVFNECSSLSDVYSCYVLAPRQRKDRFFEKVGPVTCVRYPHFEADHFLLLFLEYAIAAFWIALLVPLITFAKRISVIHVANPPDFIVPIISWLRLFRRKIIYDMHDLSVETLWGKCENRQIICKLLSPFLRAFEFLSIYLADLVITTNTSILDHAKQKSAHKEMYVVRNGNSIVYQEIAEIHKSTGTNVVSIGYFGLLANDAAAGVENIVVLSKALTENGVNFQFSIVGDGAGLTALREKVIRANMEERFVFHGFVPIPQAFSLIKDFDFGVVSWGYLPKNHLHTAMKVMDYMCCAVPVCSLRLKEQVNTTRNIGIHADTFEEIAKKIKDVFSDAAKYETLRRETLTHFNNFLSWEYQERKLITAYASLLSSA